MKSLKVGDVIFWKYAYGVVVEVTYNTCRVIWDDGTYPTRESAHLDGAYFDFVTDIFQGMEIPENVKYYG